MESFKYGAKLAMGFLTVVAVAVTVVAAFAQVLQLAFPAQVREIREKLVMAPVYTQTAYATPSPHPTPAPYATPIPYPTSVPLTTIPSASPWETDLTQIPETGYRLEWDLKAGQTLVLTGGQFQIGDVFCGGDARQLCVLLFEATRDQRMTVGSLIVRQNWVGITSKLNPDGALQDKEPLFWMPPNCTSGCSKATVLFFKDGSFVKTQGMTSP